MQNEITELRNQVRTLKRAACLACCLFVVFLFVGCNTKSTAVVSSSVPEYDPKVLTPQQLDTLLDRDDSTIETEIGSKDTLEYLRQLLDLELTQENIDAFFEGGLEDDWYKWGSSFSKESIDDLRKQLEVLEEAEIEKQLILERYNAINRKIPLSEHRSRALLRVYNRIEELDGVLDQNDFTLSEVEMNSNIDSIVSRAMQGEWDHDTNIRIMNMYALSFKNFADKDKDNVLDTTDNCHLYNPDQADCNGNHIGDVCDIANGISEDFNNNGIPDECE